MDKEEINDILEELHLVRPEMLQPKAKKLFTAIMIIADERDKYKKAIDKINHILNNQFDYYEYVGIINDIEYVLMEVSK